MYLAGKLTGTGKTVYCGPNTFVLWKDNAFCGPNGNDISCSGQTASLGTADSCLVCNGNDANKDCNDQCFGTAQSDGTPGGCCNLCRDSDCAGKCFGASVVDSVHQVNFSSFQVNT